MKCKHCGYVFTEQDGSVCPECFASRVDGYSNMIDSYNRTTRTTKHNSSRNIATPVPVSRTTYNQPINNKQMPNVIVLKFALIIIGFLGVIIFFFLIGKSNDYDLEEGRVEDGTVSVVISDPFNPDTTPPYTFENDEYITINQCEYNFYQAYVFGEVFNGKIAKKGNHYICIAFYAVNLSDYDTLTLADLQYKDDTGKITNAKLASSYSELLKDKTIESDTFTGFFVLEVSKTSKGIEFGVNLNDEEKIISTTFFIEEIPGFGQDDE